MRMIWTLGILGMLTGCDGREQKGAEGGDTDPGPTDDTSDMDCAETATLYPDQDGDGYGSSAEAGEGGCLDSGLEPGWSTNALDCDDEDPGVYPGATETCNELDDDCDGSEDEDVLKTWYLDYDRDGYGNNNDDFIEACDSSGSYDATEAGDCDDVNASVTGPTAWHPDADGDGFGAPDWEERACEAPEGGVTDATDCDDADEGVYPGAVEVCGDNVDSDCTGAEECSIADAVSESANPNPPWTLGWSSELDGSDLSVYSQIATEESGVRWWDPTKAEALSVSIAADGAVSLHPGPEGEYSRIRWTAYEAASCTFEATFSAVDVTTSYVYVYYLTTEGEGYLSDEIWSVGDTATLTSSVDVEPGDTIDFAVDYGSNETYYSDSTGLEGQIVCTPL